MGHHFLDTPSDILVTRLQNVNEPVWSRAQMKFVSFRGCTRPRDIFVQYPTMKESNVVSSQNEGIIFQMPWSFQVYDVFPFK